MEDVAVGVVVVLGGDRTGFRNVHHDVTVGAIDGDVDYTVDPRRKQTTHAARALLGAREVIAPEILDGARCIVGEGDFLQHDVPSVPDEDVRLHRVPRCAVEAFHDLLDSAVTMVIDVLNRPRTELRIEWCHRHEPVLAVVGVCIPSVVREIAIGVIGEIVRSSFTKATKDKLFGPSFAQATEDKSFDCSIDGGVLVESVGCVGYGAEVVGRCQPVADGVVGVRVVVGMGLRTGCADELGTAVAEPLPRRGERVGRRHDPNECLKVLDAVFKHFIMDYHV